MQYSCAYFFNDNINLDQAQYDKKIHIINKLQILGVNVRIYDPYFKTTDVFGIKPEENLDDVFANVNAAIIVTGHDEFKKYEISKFSRTINKILIDTRGIIEPTSAKDANLVFRGLGRGQ